MLKSKVAIAVALTGAFCFLQGCSTVSDHFTSQPPSVTKIATNKYRVEFTVKKSADAGPVLQKQAREICSPASHDVEDYDTENVQPFYTIVGATIKCN